MRVLVDADDADGATLPDFFYDSDFPPATPDATLAALEAEREDRTDRARRRRPGDGRRAACQRAAAGANGVLVAQRRLTEVTAAVEQVRNALLAAAAIGLLAAIVLGVMFSSTLLRRLARLRAVALRISAEGPDAPAPRDTGRDEVGDLARALARMQEELRRQEAARRSFVSTASHELRTPLTMLQGTMELLEEDLRDGGVDIEDAQLQVTNARRELRRLSALAGELLDLSRLDAAVQLRSEPVELGELTRAVAAEFHLRAHERDVELDAVQPDDGCWGRGDPDAVARVVRILLDNALRYGPTGQAVTLNTAVAAATRRSSSPTAGRASRPRSASTSSSASTAAAMPDPRAGSGSAWRSAASWPSAWAARCGSRTATRPARASCSRSPTAEPEGASGPPAGRATPSRAERLAGAAGRPLDVRLAALDLRRSPSCTRRCACPFSMWRLNIFRRAEPRLDVVGGAARDAHVDARAAGAASDFLLPQWRHLILVSVRSLNSILFGLYATCP